MNDKPIFERRTPIRPERVELYCECGGLMKWDA